MPADWLARSESTDNTPHYITLADRLRIERLALYYMIAL